MLLKDSTFNEKLKECGWNCIEYQELLKTCQCLKSELAHLNCNFDKSGSVSLFKSHLVTYKGYLRDLFKKKRVMATHVLVIMVSEERRNRKPYALPVMYVPYKSLSDSHVRDICKRVQSEMTLLGMVCAGVTTDGEFSSLRCKGDDGQPLHIIQLVRQCKEKVKHFREDLLQQIICEFMYSV